MRLRSLLRFWSRRESGPEHGCRRWERAVYLAASGDLAEGTARALDRHLLRCAGCREDLARARELRERCREVSRRRGVRESARGFWPAIREAVLQGGDAAAGLGQAAFSPLAENPAAAAPEGEPRGTPPLDGRVVVRRMRLVACAALVLGAGAWVGILFVIDDAAVPEARAALEARWAEEWNAFVSGAAAASPGVFPLDPPGGTLNPDGTAASAAPATPEGVIDAVGGPIPQPEVIDF